MIDLDAPRGVARAIALHPRGAGGALPEVVLVVANQKGLVAAGTVRAALLRVGGPCLLVLAPKRSTCEIAYSQPCGYTDRFLLGKGFNPWTHLLRVRQYYLARFFAAGANVLQLNSDVAVFHNRTRSSTASCDRPGS